MLSSDSSLQKFIRWITTPKLWGRAKILFWSDLADRTVEFYWATDFYYALGFGRHTNFNAIEGQNNADNIIYFYPYDHWHYFHDVNRWRKKKIFPDVCRVRRDEGDKDYFYALTESEKDHDPEKLGLDTSFSGDTFAHILESLTLLIDRLRVHVLRNGDIKLLHKSYPLMNARPHLGNEAHDITGSCLLSFYDVSALEHASLLVGLIADDSRSVASKSLTYFRSIFSRFVGVSFPDEHGVYNDIFESLLARIREIYDLASKGLDALDSRFMDRITKSNLVKKLDLNPRGKL